MVCDAIIPNQAALWVDDRPFLLWEIGPRRVIEHWMDTLFRSNATLRAGGALRDVAPTLLDLLGLPQPVEMTGQTLFNPVPNSAG